MRMRLLLCAAGALLFASSAAAMAGEPKKPPEDKIVCKRVYQADTGSHFTSSERVCHKASEWKDLEDETARTMRQLHDSHGVNPNDLAPGLGGGGPH
jgi:hypothetical protein